MRHILTFAEGLILIIAIIAVVSGICFTEFYFTATNLDMAALNFINGEVTGEELRQTNIDGRRLTWPEINHLSDVKELLMVKSKALWILVPMAVLPFLFSHKNRIAIASWATATFATIVVLGTTISQMNGARVIRDMLHNFFFPQGGWQFSGNSLILEMYPPKMMQESLVVICVLTAIVLLIVWVIAYLMKPQRKI